MACYNVRDLLGHWVRPRSREAAMCPHPCCRGKRPHPDRFPVLLPKGMARRLTDTELIAHLGKPGVGRSDAAVRRRKDIDPRSLWAANDVTRAKYASWELRQYWDEHPPVRRNEFGNGPAQVRGARQRATSMLYGTY